MNAVVSHPESAGQAPDAAPSVFERVGNLLGTTIKSEQDAFRLVMAGVKPRSYRLFVKHLKAPPSLIGSESTLRRRLKDNAELSEVESERVLRLSRVFVLAVELFGDEDSALEWLNTPGDWVAGAGAITPMELASKEAGARMVEASIQRTLHGIF
jgi:hypothetical protein